MLECDKIQISECNYWECEEAIDFLIKLTSEEFGFSDWENYFKYKLVEKYKTGKNKFWIARDLKGKIIGTCGGLQESETVIKMNCFYIKNEYRNLGLGQKFYDLFMEFVRKENYKTIKLCTYKEFDKAIKLYEKRGFILYEKIDNELWYTKEM